MDTVKVKRVGLLAKVRTNRQKHRKIFEEALEGYREQAIKELDAILAEARAGKRIRRAIALDEPIDQTLEYDRVIAMLEMSIEPTITLSSVAFSNYVLDQWHWSPMVSATNMKYIKMK